MTDEAPPHIQRVQEERGQLDDRRTKLRAFFSTDLFSGLAPDERTDMREQAEHMDAYQQVLNRRLERAGYPA